MLSIMKKSFLYTIFAFDLDKINTRGKCSLNYSAVFRVLTLNNLLLKK